MKSSNIAIIITTTLLVSALGHAVASAQSSAEVPEPAADGVASPTGVEVLSTRNAILVVEAGLRGQILVHDDDDALVMELSKEAGERTELGLRPGEYRVTVRIGTMILQAEVDLDREEPRLLTRALMRRMIVEEVEEEDPIDWSFGLTLGSGATTSAVPEFDELALHTLGLELTVETVSLSWRVRYGNAFFGDDGDEVTLGAARGQAPTEHLLGSDLGLMGHWGWSILALRAGVRTGVDFAVQSHPQDTILPAGEKFTKEETYYLVLRGGVVGQLLVRPFDFLGIYGETATDLFLDGTVVHAGSGGLVLYFH